MLRAVVVAIAGGALAAPPASWVGPIANQDMLYADSDSGVNYMPAVGNGFAATVVGSTDVYLAGVFNGYLTSSPSHRARIASPVNIAVVGAAVGHAGIDFRNATYYRRSLVPFSASCSAASTTSCTTASSAGVWVEQRWYAHRVRAPVLAMELEVLDADSMDTSALTVLFLSSNPGSPSTDLALSAVNSIAPPPPLAPFGSAVVNGTNLVPETNSTAFTVVAGATDLVPTAFPILVTAGGNTTLAFLTAFAATMDPTQAPGLAAQAASALSAARAAFINGSLHAEHVAAWATLWESGVEFAGRIDVAQAANASLYAILSSVRPDVQDSLSPGGLASNGYNGHTFWDCATWMYPPMLLLHPDIGESLIEYRLHRIPGAMAKAAGDGLNGTMFPWESALTGYEVCPSWAPTGTREIHISGDIAYMVWQYWRANQSMPWLQSVGYPLLANIAEFWISKATVDTALRSIAPGSNLTTLPADLRAQVLARAYALRTDPTAPLNIDDVIPPDEYHDHVNNSVFTNAVARMSLDAAVEAAIALGRPASEYAVWQSASPRLIMVWNAADNYHPEFAGYTGAYWAESLGL